MSDLYPVTPDKITLNGGIWANRQRINQRVSLKHGYHMLEAAGNFHNLRLAAGTIKGTYRGPLYIDSDLYKWLEATAYVRNDDAEINTMAETVIMLIADAQADDGYLNTYFQVVAPRWSNLKDGHELYCAGHLIEAALAHARLCDDDRLLTIARRLVDYIDTVFGDDGLSAPPGHPEIELALVDLYTETGAAHYLRLAQFFVNQRGYNKLKAGRNAAYYQDRVPVREATEIEGHAVRGLYLTCGVFDVYRATGEIALLNSVQAQWRDMVNGKIYLTGGAGARHAGERFGEAFELPNDRAYCETCAAIASILLNWRLLQLTGNSQYADLMEQTLYNGFLSGADLAGRGYFYVNPLLSRQGHTRPEWHGCACCPPNVMRTLASVTKFFATYSDDGVQVHHYSAATVAVDERIAFDMQTNYPWDGEITLTLNDDCITSAWTLQLRIPAWCDGAELSVNGEAYPLHIDTGYTSITREWRAGDRVRLLLPMPVQIIGGHPHIDAARGTVAIRRGPVVYCLEDADHSVDVLEAQINLSTQFDVTWQPDLLDGCTVIKFDGLVSTWPDATVYAPLASVPVKPVKLTAIPYHLWANRQPGPMCVWLPVAQSTTIDKGEN